jgi:hypothetical protein
LLSIEHSGKPVHSNDGSCFTLLVKKCFILRQSFTSYHKIFQTFGKKCFICWQSFTSNHSIFYNFGKKCFIGWQSFTFNPSIFTIFGQNVLISGRLLHPLQNWWVVNILLSYLWLMIHNKLRLNFYSRGSREHCDK